MFKGFEDGMIDFFWAIRFNKMCIRDRPYIAVLATRRLYDENGVPHLCVDDELRKTLEIRLITKILSFELIKAA